MKLNNEEIARCAVWFNAVQDLNPDYLEQEDFELAIKLYDVLGMKISESIRGRMQRVEQQDSQS